MRRRLLRLLPLTGATGTSRSHLNMLLRHSWPFTPGGQATERRDIRQEGGVTATHVDTTRV